MNNLKLLFRKFSNHIVKNKNLINSIKIIEIKNDLKYYSNIVYKKIETYNKNIKKGQFINKNIVNYINNNLIYKVKYEYEYYNTKIEINIICDINDLNIINDKYKKILLRVITFLDLIKDKSIKKDLILNIYLTNFKKELNDCLELKNKDIILGPKNVNSGFTDGRSITLYRNEEALKVLIHELIHYYDIDIINRNIECIECRKIFNISKKTTIIINEGFVETWANILNLLYIIFENDILNYNLLNISSNNVEKVEYSKLFNKFIIYLKSEIDFCIKQTAKILLNYNFIDYDDFLNNKNKIKSLKQGSSVFSYYIAKSIFLYNINGFLYLYFNKNINQGIFLHNYKKNDLVNLLITNSNDNDFKKKINKYMRKIKIEKKCSNSLIHLRMTNSLLSNL